MGDILSQDEIDSLLEGISTGEISTVTDKPLDAGDVVPFDFTNQDRMIRGRMPNFDLVTNRLSRMFGTSLSHSIRRMVDVEVKSVDLIKFSDFQNSLPVPTSIHIFRLDPLRGHSILVVESRLAFSLIEYYFGGRATAKVKIEGREFTPIEGRVIQNVVEIYLADMESAWKPIYTLSARYVRSENNPQFAMVVLPADLVMVVRFNVDLDGAEGSMLLCLPYSTLEPIRERLYSGFQSDKLEMDGGWNTRVEKLLRETMVDVKVELGTARITTERLLHLKKGEVIPLAQGVQSPLIAKVQDIPKFLGKAGTVRGNKAIQIEARCLER